MFVDEGVFGTAAARVRPVVTSSPTVELTPPVPRPPATRIAPRIVTAARSDTAFTSVPAGRILPLTGSIAEILAVGEVEATSACQQEFPADRRHPVIDRYARAALRQHLGRHQAGRPGTDHRNVKIRHSVYLRKSSPIGLAASCGHCFLKLTLKIENNFFAAF